MKETEQLKQIIRKSRLQQQRQQQVEEGAVDDEMRVPTSEQKEMQPLVEVPDSTLDQSTVTLSESKTKESMMLVEGNEEKESQEKKTVALDDSIDAANSTEASGGVESLVAVELEKEDKMMMDMEDKSKEGTKDLEASTTTTPCHVGQTPLAAHEVATMATTSSFEANVKNKDEATHSSDKVFPFDTILTTLQQYEAKYKTRSIPTSHPSFVDIVSHLVQHGIEDVADSLWKRNFKLLKEYKERVGDCDVPFTSKMLGAWVVRQRELYAEQQKELVEASSRQPPTAATTTTTTTEIQKLYISRFERLAQLGFDFNTPMWDVRLQELIVYKSIHDHSSPPVSYPKLGIWAINQRFNIKDMPKERVEALDSLGFVWNHNRKNRSQEKWDGRYEERE